MTLFVITLFIFGSPFVGLMEEFIILITEMFVFKAAMIHQ